MMGTVLGQLDLASRVCKKKLTALCGYSFKKILCSLFISAFQRFDEDDSVIRVRTLCIEPLDADRHGEKTTTAFPVAFCA